MVALIQAAEEHASTLLNYTQPIIAIAASCGAVMSVYVALSIRAVKAELRNEIQSVAGKIGETELRIVSSIGDTLNGYVRRGDCAVIVGSQQHLIDSIQSDLRYIRNALTPVRSQTDV